MDLWIHSLWAMEGGALAGATGAMWTCMVPPFGLSSADRLAHQEAAVAAHQPAIDAMREKTRLEEELFWRRRRAKQAADITDSDAETKAP